MVFSGRPFGGDDWVAPQPSVPSASGEGSSAANSQQDKSGAVSPGSPGAHPKAYLVAHCHRPKACKHFQAALSRPAQPMPRRVHSDNRPLSWPQFLLNGVLVVLLLGLFTVSGTTLWWMLHAWRSPVCVGSDGF